MLAFRLRSSVRSRSPAIPPIFSTVRGYAKKSKGDDFSHLKPKKGKHKPDEVLLQHNNITDPSLKFVPHSQMPHGAEYAQEEKKVDEKMQASLHWLKEQARVVEQRSGGRVTSDMLDSVKVVIDEGEDGVPVEVPLKGTANIGVRQGNTLVVTVFEESTLRAVEKALYAAKLPGLTPQRIDSRTIILPVSPPTLESRKALLSGLKEQAEETRIAIRKVHQASQKHLHTLGFAHKDPAIIDLTALVNKRLAEIDILLQSAQKAVMK